MLGDSLFSFLECRCIPPRIFGVGILSKLRTELGVVDNEGTFELRTVLGVVDKEGTEQIEPGVENPDSKMDEACRGSAAATVFFSDLRGW
jgi:hypothetical protein